jgi:hypothetical protein
MARREQGQRQPRIARRTRIGFLMCASAYGCAQAFGRVEWIFIIRFPSPPRRAGLSSAVPLGGTGFREAERIVGCTSRWHQPPRLQKTYSAAPLKGRLQQGRLGIRRSILPRG